MSQFHKSIMDVKTER